MRFSLCPREQGLAAAEGSVDFSKEGKKSEENEMVRDSNIYP
jgi:hypothetical protein